jgi:hypothetical protein
VGSNEEIPEDVDRNVDLDCPFDGRHIR